MLRSLIIGLSLILLFFAPTSAVVCGRPVATMSSLDTGHPVAPCVNTTAIMNAVTSSLDSYLLSVDVPQLDTVLLFVIYFSSALFVDMRIPYLFIFAPLTPPPR